MSVYITTFYSFARLLRSYLLCHGLAIGSGPWGGGGGGGEGIRIVATVMVIANLFKSWGGGAITPPPPPPSNYGPGMEIIEV